MSLKHFVYILQSVSDPTQFYVGLTRDPQTRVNEHNAGKSAHTKKFVPWQIVHYCWFDDSSKAADYEHYLKSGSGRAFAQRRLR